MIKESEVCCRCGGQIKPPLDPTQDWLCQKCYTETHPVRSRPTPRMGGERLLTPWEREQTMRWQVEIDERLDRTMGIPQLPRIITDPALEALVAKIEAKWKEKK